MSVPLSKQFEDVGHREKLRVGDLTPTQVDLVPAKVDKMMDKSRGDLPPILVSRHGPRMLIQDGHHRVAADMMRGRKTTVARVID